MTLKPTGVCPKYLKDDSGGSNLSFVYFPKPGLASVCHADTQSMK